MLEGVKPSLVRCGLPFLVLFVSAPGLAGQGGVPSRTPDEIPSFRHETHRTVECRACHEAPPGEEGRPDLSLSDCRSCHHGELAATSCAGCHAPADARVIARIVERTMDMQIGSLDRPRRELPMGHASHESVQCRACHAEGPALSASNVRCSGCHEAHHRPTTRCLACHETPPSSAHDRQVHLGCGGAGCHEAAPASIQSVPRTRAFCLVCHDGMAYHKPDQACASCHLLPPAGT